MSLHQGKLPSTRELSGTKVLLFLIAFRICNALLLRTFFQPDEYFQSLEPAWYTAFDGAESGAWITWEWRQGLRSSLHPVFFACVYRAADFLSHILGLKESVRSDLLLAAPKVVQAIFAAFSDYYTWQLARKAYGTSQASYGALALTIVSPWQWFCSTRTLSNSVETTLTVIALHHWPFDALQGRYQGQQHLQMCKAFAFAALATILRPTNVLIWLVIAIYTAGYASRFQVMGTIKSLLSESKAAIISGLSIFTLSVASDRLYYGDWTFPPFRFIHFNVVQSLAVFYGRNRPDYYFTEGLPLLLTTSLPFAAWGLYQALFGTATSIGATSGNTPKLTAILRPLALTVLVFVTLMSLIAHKEVRFIYPLLPILNVLAGSPFATFFTPLSRPRGHLKKLLFTSLLAVNIALAFYISQIHQRGVIDVLHFLRTENEHRHLTQQSANMTITFLMPCHSTPWRSHLVYSDIQARALTCEPPIEIPLAERDMYLDEADQFYADPQKWMMENLEARSSIAANSEGIDVVVGGRSASASAWPEYLVFFEQLEETMRGVLRETRYKVCWRGFNTHWHDDWRRKGDVVVLCLS